MTRYNPPCRLKRLIPDEDVTELAPNDYSGIDRMNREIRVKDRIIGLLCVIVAIQLGFIAALIG